MGPSETYDEIAERLTAKAKKYNKAINFTRCPQCGRVYENACGVIHCGECHYTKDGYIYNGRSVIKNKK